MYGDGMHQRNWAEKNQRRKKGLIGKGLDMFCLCFYRHVLVEILITQLFSESVSNCFYVTYVHGRPAESQGHKPGGQKPTCLCKQEHYFPEPKGPQGSYMIFHVCKVKMTTLFFRFVRVTCQ